jgi:hypothetical protein
MSDHAKRLSIATGRNESNGSKARKSPIPFLPSLPAIHFFDYSKGQPNSGIHFTFGNGSDTGITPFLRCHVC